MLSSLVHYFYPDLNKDEIKKFSYLSLTCFLIIGSYWLVRLLKNTLFFKIAFPESLGWLPHQGSLFQPIAKFYSPFVVFVLVMVYSKLVDLFKKHVLFYIICTFYTIVFGGITVMLVLRGQYGDLYLGKNLLAMMGWGSYFAIESFGSLIMALFWSFTNSICTSESAKSGYPMILACAQIGAIGGSILMIFSSHLGLSLLCGLAAFFVAAVMVAIHSLMKAVPASQMVGNKQAAARKSKKKDFIEGFYLVSS